MSDSDPRPENIRGVLVLVPCSACDGTGRVYPLESSKFEVDCDECSGDGEMPVRMSVAGLRELLAAGKP